MKILFTMLSIETTNKNYLLSAKNLTNEILKNTKHDVLISTNNTDYFNELNTDRCLVRNNIQSSSIFKYGGEFNYNLKHHSFINIPEKYDYIVYLDCDIKLTKWDEKSDEFFINKMVNYNYAADRLNCVLKNEVQEYIDGKSPLFTHKIKSSKNIKFKNFYNYS